MKTHYVGIDIAKKTLDWHAHETSLNGQVENSLMGLEKLLQQLHKGGVTPEDCFFCFEHTGSYGLILCSFLEHHKLTYTVVPAAEIQRSIGLTRGKSDRIDAQRIAQYAYTFREKLSPFQLPNKVLLMAKQLMTYRQQLVKMIAQEKNSLKALDAPGALIDVSQIRHSKEEHLAFLKQQIRLVEQQLLHTLESDQQIKDNMQLLRSVTGIGPMIATSMIVLTANFTQFDNARQFNCYSGIAPFEYTSGTSLRGPTRVSNLANKHIKTLLHSGALSAMQYDPEIRSYTERKLAENKHKRSITNAVACKLVSRAFAVIKRRTPFVTTYQQKVL